MLFLKGPSGLRWSRLPLDNGERVVPPKIEVAKSKGMAYDVGMYQSKVNDPQGNPTTIIGKYVVVWRKQPDNHWKAVADIFNPDK